MSLTAIAKKFEKEKVSYMKEVLEDNKRKIEQRKSSGMFLAQVRKQNN